jgi:signal transduction histidine kinase
MSWFHRVDAWTRANPGKLDATVAVLLGGLVTVIYGVVLIGGIATSVALGLALAWRRTRPRAALWITGAAGLVQVAAMAVKAGATNIPDGGEFSALTILIPVIAYSAVAYGNRTDARWTIAWCAVGSVLGAWGWSATLVDGTLTPSLRAMVAMLIFLLAVCGTAIVSGYLVRARRLARQALADRARRLEAEQEQERALAAADERRRIAREMHDVVAHSLSVVIAQADGARYAAAADPEIAPQTLETIATTSRAALKEMRSLLGVLRTEDDEAAPKAPAPTLAQVPRLVENVRASGLDVTLRQEGTPARPLPAGAELAGYRAAQEALTNVLKHAGPRAQATLTMTWTPHGLNLDVTDTGVGATPTDGLGRGQQGMRERVELYGGSADFGPHPNVGYQVHVFLPYEEI